MAKDKKPSIFSDRSTIGSSDELDEYGVWVKSEPQDLSSTNMEVPDFSDELPVTDDIDFSIPDMDDLPDFDSPDLELDKKVEKEDESDSDVFNFGDFTENTDFDSTELDSSELDFPENDSGEDLNEEDLNIEEPDKEDEGDFTEISMDDFIGAVDVDDSTKESEDFQVSADIQNPVDFHVSANLQESAAFQETADLEESENFQVSVDFDETVDFQETVDFGETENPAEAAVGISSSGPATASAAPEKPAVDLSTQLLMKIAEELSSIRTELSSLKKEFSGFKAMAPAAAAEADEGGFFGEEDDEKISLTGDELNNILNTADFTEEAGADAAIELSDEIEMDEENAFSSDSLKADSPSGFYSKESYSEDPDSEKLSTADLDMEIDLGDSNLMLEGETKLGNSFFSEEPSDELELSEEPVPDFADDDEELNEIREKGAEPMAFAPAPEDTDYLTEDALVEEVLETEDDFGSVEDLEGDLGEDLEIEDFSSDMPELSQEESLDLSGAVIDEPDLSSEIHDNPLEEPSLEDISISLDLSELDSLEDLDYEEPYSEEEIPAPESGDGKLIPEGFVVDESASNDSSAVDLSYDDSQPLLEEIDEELDIFETEEGSEDILEEIGEIEELAPIESKPELVTPKPAPITAPGKAAPQDIPSHLKLELKTVLTYMDQLLEALPDDKIEEFARSEYYDTYKKLFKELGLV